MILSKFIVFEGIDGAGTSTQIEQLKNRPGASDFLFTAEPTKGETGLFLRRMLRGDMTLESSTAAYLFAADRNEHLYGKFKGSGQDLTYGIAEACGDGRIVVCDRYIFSSLAYQGSSCREDLPWQLNAAFPLPQLLFYFDISPTESLKRIGNRETREIYEEEGFLRKVAEGYQAAIERLSRQEPAMKVVRLDAQKGIAELSDEIWTGIKNHVLP